MYRHLLFLFLLASSISYGQSFSVDLTYDGIDREYRIFLPSTYTEGDVLPLVFNFHGYGSNAFEQELYSQFNAVADTGNFIICYPNGTVFDGNNQWATGLGSTADDVGFVNAIIDSLHNDYNINLDRVYACGMSNGGYMSYKLACELNDRIAAIASVTGSMVSSELMTCAAIDPIPVLQIHGTADQIVPYAGSVFGIPIEDLVTYWFNFNGCSNNPDTLALPDIDTFDNSTVERIAYRDCDDDAVVYFYKIAGGGHTWPDAPLNLGVTNRDFNASSVIWNFFNQRYDLDFPTSTADLLLAPKTIHVAPNPLQEELYIESKDAAIQSILLFDALGKTIAFQSAVNSQQTNLSTSDLPSGIYFLKVTTHEGFSTLKLVK